MHDLAQRYKSRTTWVNLPLVGPDMLRRLSQGYRRLFSLGT